MKVIELQGRFGIDALRETERPTPQPGPGQVLVRMRAASLNYRDLMVCKGLYNPRMPLPRIPLSDGVGEVVSTGPGAGRFKTGDRVAGIFMQTWIEGEPTEEKGHSALGGAIDGVLAEYVLFDEQGLVALPPHLSFEEGATLPCAAVTAWNAIAHSQVKAGETVLLLGTGGVSIFALQFAKLFGLRVIITSGHDEKLARAQSMGASDGINYRAEPEWGSKVRALTGGRGADLVVEVGGAGTLAQSMQAVKTGGRIALIGVLAGGEVNPIPALMKSIHIRGIYVGSRVMFEEMNRAITLHELRPVIDRTFDWKDIQQALGYMESQAHFGKIVLRF